jgi:hypothetical protein
MNSGKLASTAVHRFALDVKLIEHDLRTENLLVKRGGIDGGLAPNHFASQAVCNSNQTVEKSGADTADAPVQMPDNLRMHCHEVHDEAMTPTAAAVGEAEQVWTWPPRSPSNEHERDFSSGIMPYGGPELSECGRGFAVPMIVGPAF